MSKVKKTVLQIAKRISKNQGSTIAQAIEEMEMTLEVELHRTQILVVDNEDGSYDLQSDNLIETIRDSATNSDLDEALSPVMLLIGLNEGGAAELFVMGYMKTDGEKSDYRKTWMNYTKNERAILLCEFVKAFVVLATDEYK